MRGEKTGKAEGMVIKGFECQRKHFLFANWRLLSRGVTWPDLPFRNIAFVVEWRMNGREETGPPQQLSPQSRWKVMRLCSGVGAGSEEMWVVY